MSALTPIPDREPPKSIADAETLSAVLALETYLNPAAFPCDEATVTAVRGQLTSGRLVVTRDAFVPSFAERIHRSLDACTTWQVYEGYEKHFHYHHHNLYKTSEYPPDLAWCDQIFGSPATKSLAHVDNKPVSRGFYDRFLRSDRECAPALTL